MYLSPRPPQTPNSKLTDEKDKKVQGKEKQKQIKGDKKEQKLWEMKSREKAAKWLSTWKEDKDWMPIDSYASEKQANLYPRTSEKLRN